MSLLVSCKHRCYINILPINEYHHFLDSNDTNVWVDSLLRTHSKVNPTEWLMQSDGVTAIFQIYVSNTSAKYLCIKNFTKIMMCKNSGLSSSTETEGKLKY